MQGYAIAGNVIARKYKLVLALKYKCINVHAAIDFACIWVRILNDIQLRPNTPKIKSKMETQQIELLFLKSTYLALKRIQLYWNISRDSVFIHHGN